MFSKTITRSSSQRVKVWECRIKRLVLFFLIAALASCGGGSTKYAGFDMEMPSALDELNSDYVRVAGSVWTIDADGNPVEEISPERDALLTIRGQYALPVKNVKKGDEYEYRLSVYYQADAYAAPAILGVEIAEPDLAACPELSLSPDNSLSTDEEGSQWLLLCEATLTGTYDPKVAIDVAEADIVCDDVDADGDGSSNLTELSLTYDPYNGDYDGDCVADGTDAFPTNPTEWLDTDSDGLGDNTDDDKDADGLDNNDEETAGTDPLDSDSDDDTIVDGSDNCPLDGSSGDQTDSDDDGEGDLCDDDADNDGLTDSTEAELGTDPADSDTDDDNVGDETEVNQGSNPLDSNTDDDQDNDGDDAFPTDATEWDDTDSDGVGNNADLCDNTSDPENTDTDGDSTGNICDDDDDNDGVSDELESSLGSNTLDTDSDDDGLEDWFGETMEAGQDPCLMDPDTSSTTDDDGDGFTTTCDLSDDPTDPSADEVNYLAIFVDSANGSDENDGSITSPVQTLDKGGELASTSTPIKPVYVTGDFDLTETFTLPDGVLFYGGFGSTFSGRDPLNNPSVLSSSTESSLVEIISTDQTTGLDGFAVTNSYSSGTTTIAVWIESAVASLKNNQITSTNSYHATGIFSENSQVTVDNNTIAVSGGSNKGYGLKVNETTGSITDNDISVDDFEAERTAVYCSNAGDSDITLTGNTFDVWVGTAIADTTAIYLRDCNPDGDQSHHLVPMDDPSTWDGFEADATNILDGLI